MHRSGELLEELRSVLSGRGAGFLDSILPLLIFLLLNSWLGVNTASGGALAAAGVIAILRIRNKESLVYALGGVGSVLLAAVFVALSGSGAGFFLPGLFSGALTVVLCIASVALRRPLVAWTSFLARRWPLGWYWHPQVMPAYSEVTIAWAVAFSGRLALELWLFQLKAVQALGVVKIALGWPFIVALLIGTYLYGLWRLARLGGPSVEEFKAGKEPPWEGQKRGF